MLSGICALNYSVKHPKRHLRFKLQFKNIHSGICAFLKKSGSHSEEVLLLLLQHFMLLNNKWQEDK
jgi:hypothetical protein